MGQLVICYAFQHVCVRLAAELGLLLLQTSHISTFSVETRP